MDRRFSIATGDKREISDVGTVRVAIRHEGAYGRRIFNGCVTLLEP